MPLSHLKVLELATILAGPAVGFFLAELGADVVKVENPRTGGDPTRGWRLGAELTPDGLSAYYCSVNWGKRSVALDLASAEDLGRFRTLLTQADILLINFKPGDAEKLGMPLDALLNEHPRLIIGWITGYGPDSARPGFDALIQAESGFMTMNGPPGGPACKLPVALIDLLAAHQLKAALLLGLLERERTGRGRLVEVSLWKSALSSLINQATNVLMNDHDPQPAGTEHPNLFPYGTILECRDGGVLVAVGTDRQFDELCAALGAPELAPEFARNADRTRCRGELREKLQELAAVLPADDLLQRLSAGSVPSGRLGSVRQALESPEAHDLLLAQGGLAALRSVAFSGFGPTRSLRPPPTLGAHTAEVLGLAKGQQIVHTAVE